MSKDEFDTHLKYGQGILIKGFKEKDDVGFLTAKGFADATAKYQTFKDLLYFKNYRNTLFQIMPAADFQLNDELRKQLEINNKQTPNVKILRARAKSEEEQFHLLIQNKQQKNVCFGDSVIFRHCDSDTYLSGTIRPSNGTNGAFTVQVTKNLSQILIFKVLPFRSYERIGMTIPFDSPVKLLNILNNGFLTFQKVGITPIPKKIDLDKKPIIADNSYTIPVKTNSAQSDTYECVTHFVDLSIASIEAAPMPWIFSLHITQIENDSLIQHDIIYFQHTQNQGVLSTQGKQIILKQMKVQAGEELPFYECLWEIQKHADATQNAYILRHLMSGMTLGIVKDAENRPIKPELFDITEGSSESKLGWVELKLAKKQKIDINSGTLINICIDDWCLDKLKEESNNEAEDDEQKSDDYVSIPKLNKLATQQLDYEVKKVKFTLQISKNCFVIKEIDDSLKKQCLFALSFHSKILDLRQDLKWGFQESEKKISYIRMMQVTEKIKEIKDFLKDKPKQQSDKQYNRPIFKRQMICKDLGISQLLFQLLFYMRKNLEGKYKKKDKKDKQGPKTYIFQGKHNEFQKFEELYNSIYEVIFELIRDNLSFKIYVSKWINFIIEDVLVENQPSHLNLLKELFKSNEFLVKNFVTDDLVKKLSDKMMNQKDSFYFHEKKYLQIFRLFCIVGGNINTSNQIKILNHFIRELRTDDVRSLYQVTLTKKDDNIQTEAAIDKNILKKRKFGDYYNICKEEYPTAWEYFVQFLNLIADMTKGRNKIVQSYMQTMFTLDILADLFQKYDLHEAEVPVIRLLHNLYAESERFYPIEKKMRISNYNQLESQVIDVMSTTSDIKPWNPPLKRVFDCLRDKLKKYDKIDPDQSLKNSNLYQILNFFWQTFNLGFWEKKQDVLQVLEHILRILEPHPKIVKNYADASVQSKDNLLVMNCKIECMNIIQLILDYDIDLSVRYICKHFQKFQIPHRKRQLSVADGMKILQYKIDDQLAIKFINEIPKDIVQLVKSQILTNMIELSKYNNPKLTSQSISIMERVLLKKKKSIQDFCQQIFVCDQQRIKLKQFIESKKNKFYILQDQTLVNINMTTQLGNYVLIYKEDQIQSGIMQDIYMMGEIIKNQQDATKISGTKTLEMSGKYKKLGTQRLINFTDERTSSNAMKQSVLDAQNIHIKVLQFIYNCVEIPTEDLALKLLHLCYSFLVSLIWNFQNIKPTLIPCIPLLVHHINKNIGCIDFLRQMYDNNKTMLFNEANMSKLVKQICQTIEKELNQSFYKSKLLDFFRYLIYCNGKALESNQILILKIMQDDSYKKILIQIDEKEIQSLVNAYQKSYEQFEKNRQNNIVKIQPRLLYIITFFQIMQSLIDDKNKVNMGKLKKKFPFNTLVYWVKISKNCWPLKRNIRAFLNRLYYFDSQIQAHMEAIKQKDLNNIIEDFNYYMLIKCKSNAAEFQNFTFQNPVRFSFLQTYLYLNLEENLFTLYQLTTNKQIEIQMKIILNPIDSSSTDGQYNFIRICERLGWIKNYFAEKKNVYTNSFIKFLLMKFRVIILDFDDSIYLPGMNIPSVVGRAPTKTQKQKARGGLIEKIMNGNIGTFFVQASGQYNEKLPLVFKVPDKISNPKDDNKKPNQNKLLKKLREILKKQKRQFKNKDEQVQYSLNRLIRAIKLSSKAQLILIEDYNKNLINYSQGNSIFQYITAIITMNSTQPEALPTKQKSFFLNLITGIVEQNNTVQRQEIKPIDEWQANDWIQSKEKIGKIQQNLKRCQLGRFITELLKQNIQDNIQFADSILLCGIAYLFGGNTSTQKNMIEQIGADTQNKVMKNIEALISKLGRFIIKNISQSKTIKDTSSQNFNITTIDNYDFYEFNKRYVHRKNVFEPQSTDEEIYSKTCIRTYRRAFKFLQLLCENNNIEGKNFIRSQPNGVKNFNFIAISAKQVRNIFTSLNAQICDVVMFLLDFILEVTQIPVKANQDDLMNLTTFFEDVCFLQNIPGKANLTLSIQQYEQMTEKIYFKALQIILSNFEGNQQSTFTQLDNKLQPSFLMNILSKKLKELGLTNKQKIIEYIDNSKECTFDDNMMIILNIIIIFKKLKEKIGQNSRVYSTYDKYKLQNGPMYQFLQNCLLEIEILNEGQKQTIIFPKYPVFNSLSENLKDAVMNQVDRGTHRAKIVSLLGYSSPIKAKIESSYSLLKMEKITEKHMNDAFKISAYMSIIICLYMIIFYDVIINYGEADFQSPRLIGLGRFVLSLIQLSMSMVYAYYWLRFKIWEKPLRQPRVKQKETEDQSVSDEGNKYIKKCISIVQLILKKSKIDVIFELIIFVLKGGDTQQPLYSSAQFYRVAIYTSVAFFGTFFYPAIFFLHIMDIFCYNPQIGDIFKAIGLNIKELAYVSVMGVVFTFVFCTVTFSNYLKNVYTGQEATDQMCHSMLDCIMQLFVSGAIGETMQSFEPIRFTYDMLYFIFFGILFSNITSGIILDSFASLREKNNTLTHDKENFCYICNISRENLQKQRQSLHKHIHGKHFLWNYVFFIYFLDAKSPTDYSGMQYQITTQYNKTDEEMMIDWVPLGEPQEFDCKANLEEIHDSIKERTQFMQVQQESIDSIIKQFKGLTERFAA